MKHLFSSLYHFDPSNPPTKAGRYANSRKKPERQKSLNSSGKPSREHTNSINTSGNSDSDKSVVSINNKPTLTHPKVNVPSNNDDQIDLPAIEAPRNCEPSSDDVGKTKDTEQCELKCEF